MDLNLESPMNVISSIMTNDLSEGDSNLRNLKSWSTKDSSIKNSYLKDNKMFDSASIEDMHIIFVKFYHQSRKIEKNNLKNNDERLKQIREENHTIVWFEEETYF